MQQWWQCGIVADTRPTRDSPFMHNWSRAVHALDILKKKLKVKVAMVCDVHVFDVLTEICE